VRATCPGTSPNGQKLNIEVWLYPGQRLVVEDLFSPEPNNAKLSYEEGEK